MNFRTDYNKQVSGSKAAHGSILSVARSLGSRVAANGDGSRFASLTKNFPPAKLRQN